MISRTSSQDGVSVAATEGCSLSTSPVFLMYFHMSRNVVVPFAEGYSDDSDDKKIGGGRYDFCSRFGGNISWPLCQKVEEGLNTRLYSTETSIPRFNLTNQHFFPHFNN